MKKLTLLLLLAVPFTAFSQIEKPITKGNVILSGGAYGEYSREKSVSSYLSITPGAGYFFVDNLAVGINTNMTFGNSRFMSYNGYSGKYYTLGAGPYVRYYFNNGIFLKTESLYSFYRETGPSPYTDSKRKFREYMIIPGFGYAFFINPKVSLETGVSYLYYNSITNDYRKQHGLIPKMNSVIFEIKFNLFL